MNVIIFKSAVLEEAKHVLNDKIAFLEQTIISTQNEANSHKGAMQSRYDTFKEEAQYLRGGYEKQLYEAINDLKILNQISPVESNTIKLGAIIKTNEIENETGNETLKTYFVSTSVSNKPLLVDNIEVICIKYSTPFIGAISNKLTGETIPFRNKLIEILDIL